MKKSINNISDFKIISISLSAAIIFFTIYFFRYLPLNLFKIDIKSLNKTILMVYLIIMLIINLTITTNFILKYMKKNNEELKRRFYSIGTGLGVLFVYFILPYFQGLPFALLNINVDNISLTSKVIYLIAFSILTMAIILLIYNKKIVKDYKDMKKNNLKYFNKYIKYWLCGLFIMMVSNLLINLLVSNSLPSNEQTIRETFNISPLYIFFEAVIYAPIVEELVFRLSIKKIFSNKWAFVILSGLIFGSMHVFGNFNNLADLLYIIPYSAPGIVFALMLKDSDNILVPMSFHLLHNGILISLQFIILLFG